MVFIPDHVPPQALDDGTRYVADVPFDAQQARITTRRHRWFQQITIGTPSGPYSIVAGLTTGATQRITFDHKPDFIIVSVAGSTAATGRVNLFLGEPGGPAIGPIGPGGKVCIPAPEGGIITLVNVGSTSTFGVVVAVAGYAEPGIDVVLGG